MIDVKQMSDEDLMSQVDQYYADYAMEDRVSSTKDEQIEFLVEEELVKRGYEIDYIETVNEYDEVVGYEANIYMRMK